MVEILFKMGIIFMAMLILIFNIWTTNTATAYSFGVAGAEFFNKPNKEPFVIGGLIIATIMSITGIHEYFLGVLTLLGIFVPPLGGLLIGDYLYHWRKKLPIIHHVKFKTVHYPNLIAYLLATLGAYLSQVFQIGFPSLNGIILAIILVFVVNGLFKMVGKSVGHEIEMNTDYRY